MDRGCPLRQNQDKPFGPKKRESQLVRYLAAKPYPLRPLPTPSPRAFIFGRAILLAVGTLFAIQASGQITPATIDSIQKKEVGVRFPFLDILDIILTTRDSVDGRYIEVYPRVFSPRLFYGGKIVTFGFSPSNSNVHNMLYYPNTRTNFGIGAFYGIFGLSFSYNLSNDSEDRIKKYGRTDFFDGAFNSYQVSYGYDLFYQSYRGFFTAKETSPISPTIPKINEGVYNQRRDIVLRSGGANYYKIYNYRKFSMQAAFPQVRRQLKSAGSLLHFIGMSYMTIKGDAPITSPTTDNPQGMDSTAAYFDKGRFLTVTLSPGYGHTFVVKHFYVSGVLFLGPGLQVQDLELNRRNDYHLSPFLRTNFRASLGFNSERFFTALQVMYDHSRNYVEGVRLQATNNGYSLQVGYRF